MNSSNNKKRVLMLLQLMLKYTDEDHPMSTSEIVAWFDSQHIVYERRTVKQDLDLLTEMGYDIVTVKSQRNQYFLGERDLQPVEIRLLTDAVYASKLITAAKSEVLASKLGALLSVHQAEAMKRHPLLTDRTKPTNETVYYAIDAVSRAMDAGKKLSFRYIEYLPNKQCTLKHDGQIYTISPYCLVWNEDHYYLLGHSDVHNRVIPFRVDRMVDVIVVSDVTVAPPPEFCAADYTRVVFDMFSGRTERVTLRCANELMRVIIDRFGEFVETRICDSEHFEVSVTAAVSPTFFGWVFQFSGGIEIVAPPHVQQQYKEMWKQEM